MRNTIKKSPTNPSFTSASRQQSDQSSGTGHLPLIRRSAPPALSHMSAQTYVALNQTIGNQAVQRLLARQSQANDTTIADSTTAVIAAGQHLSHDPKHPVLPPPTTGQNLVQRKVGFEFEVEVPLYMEGKDVDIFGDRKKQATKFAKDEKLHDQAEFYIVQDHSAKPLTGIETMPEFVIHPMEENLPLAQFLANVQAAQTYIADSKGTANLKDGAKAGDGQLPLTDQRQGGAQATSVSVWKESRAASPLKRSRCRNAPFFTRAKF